MIQLDLRYEMEREAGAMLGELCADKSERVAWFDRAGAAKFILSWLRRHGPMPGESLTYAANEHRFRPHDARAFGPVYAKLARDGVIQCVGFCPRIRGHGTSGGRIWSAA